MKKITYGIALIVMLVLGLAVGAMAQARSVTTDFEPFTMDISETMPMEVLVSLPDADDVTVPLTVTVTLQVRVDSPGNSQALSATISPVAAPLPAREYEDADAVVAGETQWRLLRAEDVGSTIKRKPEWRNTPDPQTTGKFIVVFFEIENLGKEPVRFESPHLVDDQGREFESSLYVHNFLPDADICSATALNPNLQYRCAAIYEVPAGASGFAVAAHDLHFRRYISEEREKIPLGF